MRMPAALLPAPTVPYSVVVMSGGTDHAAVSRESS